MLDDRRRRLDRAASLVGFWMAVAATLANTVKARLIGLAVVAAAFGAWMVIRRNPKLFAKGAGAVVAVGAVVAFAVSVRTVPDTVTHTGTPSMRTELQVRNLTRDEQGWAPETGAAPGDSLEFLLTVENTGAATLTGVTVSASPPPNTTPVENTVRWITVDGDAGQDLEHFLGGGLTTGNYNPGGGFHVQYTAVVNNTIEECHTRVRGRAFAAADQLTERETTADVTITSC